MFYITVLLSITLCLIIIFFLSAKIIALKHGDCAISLDKSKIKNKLLSEKDEKLFFTFDIPFINEGKQHALIIDCNARLQPKGDIFRYSKVSCRVINTDNVRFDDYWEGLVLKPKKVANLKILVSIESPEKDNIKNNLDKFSIDILFRYYGRGLMRFERTVVNFTLPEFEKTENSLELKDLFKVPEKIIKENPNAQSAPSYSVKTHILMQGEDAVDIIRQYIPNPNPGDIFTIAESALAIIQSRVYYVDDIKPSSLAVTLSHFLKMDSSLSSPYSMQKAMEEVGTWRIILAVFAGMAGKLIGRSGDFYRVAGKPAAVIDDCTGTLPPFDRYIVMGPAKMKEELERIKKETGMDCAVVDVNDLRRVDVLASTCPDKKDLIEKALEYNPAGNGNEQTPIVVIKGSHN